MLLPANFLHRQFTESHIQVVLQRQRVLFRMSINIRRGIRQSHHPAVHAAVVAFVKNDMLPNGHWAIRHNVVCDHRFHTASIKERRDMVPPRPPWVNSQ